MQVGVEGFAADLTRYVVLAHDPAVRVVAALVAAAGRALALAAPGVVLGAELTRAAVTRDRPATVEAG